MARWGKYFCLLLLSQGICGLRAAAVGPQAVPVDTTLTIGRVVVTAPLKQGGAGRTMPAAASRFALRRMERERILSVKELSLATPNFYQPEYGSRMTSTIYVRGMGARIDQPAAGLYVDEVPCMNKNGYDFDFLDVARVEVLRGPQGTLYGRNAMAGAVVVATLAPLDWQGVRFGAEYGTGNSWRVRGSVYARPTPRTGLSAAASYYHTDGFYRNEYTGRMCDASDEANARLRWQQLLRGGWMLDAQATLGRVEQGGYPYRRIDETGAVLPVAYNDPCGYRRTAAGGALRLAHRGGRSEFSSVTGYHYLDDRMTLDQDFTPRSMFTLVQAQREHVLTEELTWRTRSAGRRWQGVSGIFGFWRGNTMNAPVTFKEDGIRDLILDNANAGIAGVFPGERIEIEERQFVIGSRFRIPAWGAALYHQSAVKLGRWTLIAGLRLDWEQSCMRYDSRADIRFRLTPDPFVPLETRFEGTERLSFVELLPSASVRYEHGRGYFYLTAGKGYKAGGFNTQIFSDLLQKQLMGDMMERLGLHPDFDGPDAGAVRYDPEYSWNYEAGLHFDWARGRLSADAALFWIECRDQQLTVFPPGQNTGRMMTNAGRTRSRGVETTLRYAGGNVQVEAAWGYVDARFVRYSDGRNDWAGHRIPYAPQHTLSLGADWEIPLRGRWVDRLVLHADWRGVGPIAWNEAGTRVQPFYGRAGASVGIWRRGIGLIVWGRNLADTEYDTFYFVSVGNGFLQRGRPREIGVTLSMDL